MYTPFRLEVISNKDVYGGGVINILRNMMGNFERELRESRAEYGRDWDKYIHDMAREGADRMFFEHNKTDATSGPPIAKKFTTQADYDVLEERNKTTIEEYLQPDIGSY